jgi:hypothetical protein
MSTNDLNVPPPSSLNVIAFFTPSVMAIALYAGLGRVRDASVIALACVAAYVTWKVLYARATRSVRTSPGS